MESEKRKVNSVLIFHFSLIKFALLDFCRAQVSVFGVNNQVFNRFITRRLKTDFYGLGFE